MPIAKDVALREASKRIKIPRGTLRDRRKNKSATGPLKRKIPLFSFQEEKELVE